MATLEDLKRIKEAALTSMSNRESGRFPRIVIGMGTCGIAAGARDVMTAVLDELDKRGLDVSVNQTGCLGLCVQEPLMEIFDKDENRIVYVKVNPNRARQIIASHLINGQIIQEWTLNG